MLDGHYSVASDQLFASPSAAACFVSGSSRNGRDVWKDGSDQSIKELEEASLLSGFRTLARGGLGLARATLLFQTLMAALVVRYVVLG